MTSSLTDGKLKEEIGDLLYYMMTAYGDTDVADKAKFYYALMTGAADPKIKLVLQNIHFDKESVHEALSSILPENTEKQSLAKIIPLEKAIFAWDRISEGTSAILLEKERTLPIATEASEELHVYLEHLTKHDFSVDICCRLTLKEDSEFAIAHAITVHVDPAEHLHDVPDIHVACLQKQAHHDIVIKLRPVLPLPQRLSFHVEFACEQKKTYSVKLPFVDVPFEQFLLLLPWKPNVECLSNFFTNLRIWLLGDESNRRLDGIESVKAFEISPEKFEQVHQKHLKGFQLGQHHSFEFSQYAIFLPPHHHILLQCQGQKDNRLVISIAMTTWTMLPHVDKLLDNFMR